MQHNGWNFLSNISVRAKLALGFSLLIGMILLVAYTGWQATDALRDRSERIGDISGYSTLARDMRIERLVYIVKADDAQAAKWLAALDKIDAQLQSIVPNFNSKANEALLSEAQGALKRYRDFYTQVVTATRERAAIQQAATATAEAANSYLLALATAARSSKMLAPSGAGSITDMRWPAICSFDRPVSCSARLLAVSTRKSSTAPSGPGTLRSTKKASRLASEAAA